MTKALQLARTFHRAGHRVVLVETAKYRWTGTASPARSTASTPSRRQVRRLRAGAAGDRARRGRRRLRPGLLARRQPARRRRQGAAVGALRGVHADAGTVRTLDDKFAFSAAAAALGLPVPAAPPHPGSRQVVARRRTGRRALRPQEHPLRPGPAGSTSRRCRGPRASRPRRSLPRRRSPPTRHGSCRGW